MKTRIGAVVVLVAALAGGATAARGEVFQVGNLIFEADGKVKPGKLPKKKMKPVKQLQIEAHMSTDDGSTPPIVREVVVDFDKNGKVFTKGLPTCKTRQLENTLTKQALNQCKKALVGFGETNGIIDFADHEPFEAAGPLLAFNGKPKGKNPTLIFHVYACVPAPTTFVVPAKLTKAPGKKYGTRVTADIPVITGDNGVLTDFEVSLGGKGKVIPRCPTPGDPIKVKSQTKWKHKGKKRSYIQARCRNKKFLAHTHVEMEPHRASNPLVQSEIDLDVVESCKQKTRKKRK